MRWNRSLWCSSLQNFVFGLISKLHYIVYAYILKLCLFLVMDNDGEWFPATEYQLFRDECFDRFLKLFVRQIVLRKRNVFARLHYFPAILRLRSPEQRFRHRHWTLFRRDFRLAPPVNFRKRMILRWIGDGNRFLLRFYLRVIFTRRRGIWVWVSFGVDYLFIVVDDDLFRQISNVGRICAAISGSDKRVVDIRLCSAVYGTSGGEDGGFGGEKSDDDEVSEDEHEERSGDDVRDTAEKLAGDLDGERKGSEYPTE